MNPSDDEIEILEEIPTCKQRVQSPPKLLVENNQPLKIYFEGFSPLESLKLMETVKKYGGEAVSYTGPRVIILARPEHRASTEFTRFHVDWLNHTIKFNRVQDLPKYKLKSANPIIKTEIKKEDVSADESNAVPETVNDPLGSTNDPVDDDASCEGQHSDAQKRKRNVKQKPSKSPGGKKKRHSRRNRYTLDKEKAMVEYLINRKAILRAGSLATWKKMLRENELMKRHTPASVVAHFVQRTLHRVHFYTEDEEALKEFDKLAEEKQKKFLKRHHKTMK